MANDNDQIVFGAPDIRDAEIEEVANTLRSGWIGTGSKVKKFENNFAKYKNIEADKVIAVNSCTAALHLALIASGVGVGDEVITTATTFCATANSIIHAGGTPIFVDIDPQTLNINMSLIEDAITAKTKAIVPVHMGGLPCEMDIIMGVAEKYNLKVIEDCAHAIESEYKGRKLGTIGDYGCFSFYTTKNVVTAEGGMVIGKDRRMIEKCRMLSLHGMDNDAWKRFGKSGYKHYTVKYAGYKYNMTDINASLGIHQLARVDESRKRRKLIYNYYMNSFEGLSVILPPIAQEDFKHAYHLFLLQVDMESTGISRDNFIEKMKMENIGTGVHYTSLVEQSFYKDKYNIKEEDFCESVRYGRRTVSLPLSSALNDESVSRIVETVKRICG